MERLTKRLEDGQAIFHECHGTCGTCDGANCYCIGLMVDRLAAYEDTGLEPGEIRYLGDLREMKREIIFGVTSERLKELAEADKAGRLVVLPCKVGATVYGHSKAEVSEYKVAVISLATYNWYLRCQNHNSDFWVTDADIGKTVFLTREEAETALKGGEG